MHCDFCNVEIHEHNCWTYQASNFIGRVLLDELGQLTRPGGTVICQSVGEWAACDVCRSLIDADKRAELAMRTAVRFVEIHPELGLMAEELQREFHAMHGRFFDHRVWKPPTKGRPA